MKGRLRAHSKSRRGCIRCKRRKIKCDEARPRCSSCVRRDDECIYPSPFAAESQGTSNAKEPAPLSSEPSSSRTPDSGPSLTSSTVGKPHGGRPSPGTPAPANGEHDLRLLWHYFRTVAPQDTIDPVIIDIRQADFVEEALRCRFLMDALLSLSAWHLLAHGDTTADWALVAETKNGPALSGYIATLSDVSDDNVLAVFCCSTILPVNLLASSATGVSKPVDPDSVINTICTLFRLQCGIATVMRTFKSDALWKSRICQMMTRAAQVTPRDLPPETTQILDALREHLRTSAEHQPDLSGVCVSAVNHLQRCMSLLSRDGEALDIDAEHVLGWSVLCGEAFVEALASKEPPALAVLCAFGAALHHLRRFWFVGEWGRWIVHASSSILDTRWAVPVVWAQKCVK